MFYFTGNYKNLSWGLYIALKQYQLKITKRLNNFYSKLINTLDGFKSLIGQNPVTCESVNGGIKTGFGK